MKIKIKDAPEGFKFDLEATYKVYNPISMGFVFDDDCEACYLRDMDWEEVTDED